LPSPRTEPSPERASRPCEQEVELRLLARYHRFREEAVRDDLVRRFEPLARSLAARYRFGPEPLEDLIQVASIGLIKAIERFDPAFGVAFSTYAVPTILGELKRHFRDQGWALHVPRRVKERVREIEAVAGRLSGELGRSPSAEDIAQALGTSVEKVLEGLDAARARSAVPLEPLGDREDEPGPAHAERLGREDLRLDVVEDLSAVDAALSVLPAREQLVLRLRLQGSFTQSEIGHLVGLSQIQVSRLLRRSLRELSARDPAASLSPAA
jgi:RNA polymerase sigma-B factor